MEEKKEKKESLQRTVGQIIEEVQDDVCNNFCKYASALDEEYLCEYVRDGKSCPLHRLL